MPAHPKASQILPKAAPTKSFSKDREVVLKQTLGMLLVTGDLRDQ